MHSIHSRQQVLFVMVVPYMLAAVSNLSTPPTCSAAAAAGCCPALHHWLLLQGVLPAQAPEPLVLLSCWHCWRLVLAAAWPSAAAQRRRVSAGLQHLLQVLAQGACSCCWAQAQVTRWLRGCAVLRCVCAVLPSAGPAAHHYQPGQPVVQERKQKQHTSARAAGR